MNRRRLMFGLLACLAPWHTSAQEVTPPTGYPSSYQAILDGARSEQGLLIYSNFPETIWRPALAAFKKAYPWIKVETANFDSELWEKYFVESSAKTRTADLITTVAPERWVDFSKRGQIENYTSAEISHLPDWSRPLKGLYTIATVPMPIAWNKALVTTPPQSLKDIADMAAANPAGFKGRLTTFDAESNPYGLAIFRNWIAHKKDWSLLEALGPYTRPERSGGTMREKLTTGEYMAGFFLSGASIASFETPAVKATMGYTFAKDGTPVSLQNMAITKNASSPNSAKIFLDWSLSRAGQIAFAQAGFAPYRDDIAPGDVPFFTLSKIREMVGPENVFLMSFDENVLATGDEVRERWIKAFRRN